MRFLQKDLKKVYVFSAKQEDNGYVGKKTVYAPFLELEGNISPAASKLNVQAFGEEAYNMIQIMCNKNDDIKLGQRLSLTGPNKPEYKVVSVLNYTYHMTIYAQVI